MKKYKILLGCGGKAGLEACKLLKEQHDKGNIEFVGIIRDNKKRWYDRFNWNPQKFALVNKIPIVDSITDVEHDFFLSVLYWDVLTSDELKSANIDNINFHLAPLPDYRGSNVCMHAILNGEKVFGATCHRMIEKVDAGQIYKVEKVSVSDNDTAFSLYVKVTSASIKLFKEFLNIIINNKFQDISFYEQKSGKYFFPKEDVSKYLIITNPKKETRKIRAMTFEPFEPCYKIENGKKIWYTYDVENKKVLEHYNPPWEFFR